MKISFYTPFKYAGCRYGTVPYLESEPVEVSEKLWIVERLRHQLGQPGLDPFQAVHLITISVRCIAIKELNLRDTSNVVVHKTGRKMMASTCSISLETLVTNPIE